MLTPPESVDKTALLTQFSPFNDLFWNINNTPLKLPKMQWLLCYKDIASVSINYITLDHRLSIDWTFSTEKGAS